MISLIERKMSEDDPRVWARYLNSQKCEPSMDNLLSWMEAEMTARLRSGAQIRKNVRQHRVNTFGCKMENMEKIDSNQSNVMYVKVDTI